MKCNTLCSKQINWNVIWPESSSLFHTSYILRYFRFQDGRRILNRRYRAAWDDGIWKEKLSEEFLHSFSRSSHFLLVHKSCRYGFLEIKSSFAALMLNFAPPLPVAWFACLKWLPDCSETSFVGHDIILVRSVIVQFNFFSFSQEPGDMSV